MASGMDNGRAKLTIRLSYVITALWIASFILAAVDRTYQPPAAIHALMLSVAGFMFGEGLVKRNDRNSNGNGSSTLPKEADS